MSNNVELEDTIVGRFEVDGLVKGAIETPVNCDSPVYYKAHIIDRGDGVSVIKGVAGFDATYERAPFRWLWKRAENMVVVGDWSRRETVPADVFSQYADAVFYMRDGAVVSCHAGEDDADCFPYYRYPRTKDGPILPELVMHVLGPTRAAGAVILLVEAMP